MNRYVHACVCEVIGLIKFGWLKITRSSRFECSFVNLVSPGTEITLDRGGKLKIGKGFKMRNNSRLRVRKNAHVVIGKNFNMGDGSFVTAYENIEIGDDVQFGPGVKVYDQDHDFKAEGGLKAMKFKTAPVKIGSNVWIGADCIICRGTEIGDNSVVGAGSILKGVYPMNSVITQKRLTEIRGVQG